MLVWAGETTHEALAARRLLPKTGQAAPSTQVELHFASPTAFRSGGKQVPIPMPDLVFGSLVEHWNAFSPIVLAEEARRYRRRVRGHQALRPGIPHLGLKEGAVRVGGVGDCWYVALNHDRYWLAVLSLLADFAFWSGVGVLTSIGLGQCRRLML